MTSYELHQVGGMDIDQETLMRFLSYDPETGVFKRIAAMGKRHAKKVGLPCGTVNKATGYVEIAVGGANHYAHRLAWIFMCGAVPDGMRIDHANRTRSDNRWPNLRLATHADNLRNCKLRTDNTSGVKGVHFDRARGRWTASIGNTKLGRFDSLAAATAARQAAAERVFGAFANEITAG